MKRKIKNNHGMTLIEMLIVIAIIGIVSTLVGSFFTTSEVVFREGQEQTVEQHAVRIAADILAKEIRNATELNLFPNSASLSGFDHYYYIDSNQLVKYDGVTETTRTQDDLSAETDFPPGLDFDLTGGSNVYFLEYTVVGSDGFEVSSKVLLNNIDNDVIDDLGISIPKSGAVIGFSKP